MNIVTLKPSKEKSLLRRHPWVYANAIDQKFACYLEPREEKE